MKRALSALLFAFVALAVTAPPAPAFQATNARYYDVQRLQDDLAVLDDSLAALPTTHRRHREFSDRADGLRRELERLQTDVDRSRSVSRATIDGLRERIHVLHGDIDTVLNRGYNRRAGSRFVLPEGTEMTVRLEQPLSSRTARV